MFRQADKCSERLNNPIMSLASIQSSISGIHREIQNLHNRLGDKAKDEASKSTRIAQITGSINKHTSPSTIEGKEREVQRLRADIARIQHDKAGLTKQIADKTAQLHRYEGDLFKEQGREQKKFLDSLERERTQQARRGHLLFTGLRVGLSEQTPDMNTITTERPKPAYAAFISHASEDKDFVPPLAEELIRQGHSIWYDEFELKVGDSLRRSIDKGLANSKFGIVVLSPSFFAKNWPQYELDGLVAKEMSSGKVVLPIWHKVSKDEVLHYSPTLADKLALSTAIYTIQELAQKLGDVINGR